MNPIESVQFLAQAAQDLAASLPPSARGPFLATAQHHIQVLETAIAPPKESEN